ncbi:N-acetyltransferase [Microlunatus endophyticus]|uniref:N-acetyltransferase n=1 Tax=Microlunatus endophyticus TaxID=1716077 RepID=A0A917W0X3_9ACTN|nr:GNAT family N-acetyltransferase [Microlunatus endophyticus]GGL48904.1 N-acetyltransferase [Microlunatus endophyticus]
MYDLEFTTSAADFLNRAGSYLSEHPVVENVVATTADRAIREEAEGVLGRPGPWWFLTVSKAGQVVGVAMRTGPEPEYAVWVGEMPGGAAHELGRALVDRDEAVRMLTGSLDPAATVADHLAASRSGQVRIAERTRLFELGGLVPPTGVSGALRAATEEDLEPLHRWREAFLAEAEQQAGRPVVSRPAKDPEETRRRIQDHRLWVWEDGRQLVQMTGANPPSAGVARIGPVYTPEPSRGHGYVSAAVAAVSKLFLDQGARVCLFTDQANPVSNRIYRRIGYRPMVDMAQLIID